MSEDELVEEIQHNFALLSQLNRDLTVSTLCGLLVGILEFYVEQEDGDPSKEIVLDSDKSFRKITIHRLEQP